MKVKYSLIVSAYNVDKYIDNCLSSLINQKYNNYEIIIINDGSTDLTTKIIEKYKYNSKVKYFFKENGGLSDARNYGLSKSTGEYIWFIDGDDYIEIDALTTIDNYIKNYNYDIVMFQMNKIVKNKKKLIVDSFQWENEEYKPLTINSACNKIFKKNFLNNNNFTFIKDHIYEDLEIIPYFMAIAKKIKYIYEPFYNYVIRNNSIMHQDKIFNENKDDKILVLNSLKNKFTKGKIIKKYNKQIEYLYIRHLVFMYSSEILVFKKDIYYDRCNNVNNILLNLNSSWEKNIYLQNSSCYSKIYAILFKNKLYIICKIIIILRKMLKK